MERFRWRLCPTYDSNVRICGWIPQMYAGLAVRGVGAWIMWWSPKLRLIFRPQSLSWNHVFHFWGKTVKIFSSGLKISLPLWAPCKDLILKIWFNLFFFYSFTVADCNTLFTMDGLFTDLCSRLRCSTHTHKHTQLHQSQLRSHWFCSSPWVGNEALTIAELKVQIPTGPLPSATVHWSVCI